jgi:serine/threonine protein phosphatase PrpC
MQYISSSRTDVGRVRSANEDNHGEAQTPNGHVFVVCDGMGGHVGGATASQIAVSSVLEYFQKEKYENLIQALDRSLVFANEQVYARAVTDPGLKGMGTTALVLIVRGDECYIGHVGDSRIYLKSDGKLNRLTKDHSFVQTLVDSGVISDEDAESHPNKNQILKALGISPNLEPTICQSPILPKQGDVFMLCSDGMNGMVNDRSMEMMVDFDDLGRSSNTLIQAALDAGGHDNVTVTLVGITESTYSTSQFKHYNPRPKFDAGSTQTFGDSVSENSKNKTKKLWIFVAASAIAVLLIVCIFFYFTREVELDELPDENKTISMVEISKWPAEEIAALKKYDVELPDTTVRASNNKFIITISERKVVEISNNNQDESTNNEIELKVDSGQYKKVKKGKPDDKDSSDALEDKDDQEAEEGTKKEAEERAKKEAEEKAKKEEEEKAKKEAEEKAKKEADEKAQKESDEKAKKSSSSKSCSYSYTVKSGDNLGKISRNLNNNTKCKSLTKDKIYTDNKNKLQSKDDLPLETVLKGECDCD